MRPAIILCIMLLFVFPAMACVDDRECPIPTCLGAVRTCDLGTCKQSTCLNSLTTKSQQENGYVTIGGIAEQKTLANQTTDFLTFIRGQWPALIGLVIFLIVVSRAYDKYGVNAQFLMVLIIAALILIGTYQMLFALFSLKDRIGIWDRMAPQDFHQNGGTDLAMTLTAEERDNAAPGTTDVERWYVYHDGREYSVAILRFKNQTAVSEWRFPQLPFTRQRIADELMYRADVDGATIYLFDENRFVFIVAGQDGTLDQELQDIVSRYPYRTDRWRTHLSLRGSSSPTFFALEPASESSTGFEDFKFSVSDDVAVDQNTINVIGIPGFTPRSCIEGEEDFTCAFTTAFHTGWNSFTLVAKDNAGNEGKKTVRIYKDRTAPKVVKTVPTEGEIINSTYFSFDLEDDYGIDITTIQVLGIDGFTYPTQNCQQLNASSILCEFAADPKEGLNIWTIRAKDKAGNSVEKTTTFTYANSPRIQVQSPAEGSYTNNPTLIFLVGNRDGLEQKSIIVSTTAGYDEVLPLCQTFGKGFDINYRCQKDFPQVEGPVTVTITSIDQEDSVSKIAHRFYVDLTPPAFSSIKTLQRTGYNQVNFTMEDTLSGIDMDTFEFSGVNTLDITLQCDDKDPPIHSINCSIGLGNLPRGRSQLKLSILDRAANLGVKTVDLDVS